MVRTTLLLVSIVSLLLLVPCASFCEDGQVSGEVTGTARLTDHTGNKAKLYEYDDDRDGVYGGFRLHGEKDGHYIDAHAADIGYDTQQYRLEGGSGGATVTICDIRRFPTISPSEPAVFTAAPVRPRSRTRYNLRAPT